MSRGSARRSGLEHLERRGAPGSRRRRCPAAEPCARRRRPRHAGHPRWHSASASPRPAMAGRRHQTATARHRGAQASAPESPRRSAGAAPPDRAPPTPGPGPRQHHQHRPGASGVRVSECQGKPRPLPAIRKHRNPDRAHVRPRNELTTSHPLQRLKPERAEAQQRHQRAGSQINNAPPRLLLSRVPGRAQAASASAPRRAEGELSRHRRRGPTGASVFVGAAVPVSRVRLLPYLTPRGMAMSRLPPTLTGRGARRPPSSSGYRSGPV